MLETLSPLFCESHQQPVQPELFHYHSDIAQFSSPPKLHIHKQVYSNRVKLLQEKEAKKKEKLRKQQISQDRSKLKQAGESHQRKTERKNIPAIGVISKHTRSKVKGDFAIKLNSLIEAGSKTGYIAVVKS